MDYRGLGSGIIRALQYDSNIEFSNEVSGDQFRVILWRSDLKSKDKILDVLRLNPETTTSELMLVTALSRSGVEKILRQLKESGKIRRVGSDKGGYRKICD